MTAGGLETMQSDRAQLKRLSSVRRYMLVGFGIIFMLVGGVGVWAAQTNIAGAVIATGVVVVESSVKKVQHPTGGVVGEIHVKDGDHVEAGDLVLRLDETVTRANLQMITKQLDEMYIREARLKAERDGSDGFALPSALASRKDAADVQDILQGERSLFESRRQSRDGQKAQLRERIAQLDQEFAGVTGQITAKKLEIDLIGQQIADLETLEAKQLVTAATMVAHRREAARLQGEFGQLRAAAAQVQGKKAEIELQILRIDQDTRTEVVQELREIQGRAAEYVERKVAAKDQLKRIELRSPQSGTVHQLAVHTVGGVINGGEPVMLIVPDGDKLIVEARVSPQDIDQILMSHSALLRFAAFNQRTTPEVIGRIKSIAADLTQDQRTGDAYYVTRIEISDSELARLGDNNLVPGMPAEVMIRTHDRTALSYFIKPLEDQIARAFRER
jgi:membrane fusion protein, type I secretion system